MWKNRPTKNDNFIFKRESKIENNILKTIENLGLRHQVFPGGHPSKY